MAKVLDTWIVIIIFIILWLFFSLTMMLHIRLCAKKKWNKNFNNYPYFSNPFYKKFFLLGLKGALQSIVVYLTFVCNISVPILLILGISYTIVPNLIISYCLRIIIAISGIALLLKMGVYGCMPVNFDGK